MTPRSRAFCLRFAAIACGLAFVAACASSATTKKKAPADGDDLDFEDPPPQELPLGTSVDPDSGAFGAAARPSNREGGAAGSGEADDAGDGGVLTKTYCSGSLAPADLAVVELMVSSRSGSADEGEWVEIRSTRDCWLSLQGVSIESPRGAAASDRTTILEAFDLAPHGTFVVADSADPAKNHALPGKVFAWDATDVLKNDGDTVTVKLGDTVIDTVTYPSFSNLSAGRTLAFPDDCAPGVRADWQRWSLTFESWTTGFEGTPNAPNLDVVCY